MTERISIVGQDNDANTANLNQAVVDNHGRLYVSANVSTHEQHHATFHENLFTGSCNLTLSDSNEGPLAFYKNTHSDNDYEFYNLIVSSNAAVKIKWYTGDTYTSGGSAVTLRNMNVGSANTATATVYEGGASDDLALTTTNRVEMGTFYIGASQPLIIPMSGGLVLKTDSTWSLTATGANTNTVSVQFLLARHSAGFKL